MSQKNLKTILQRVPLELIAAEYKRRESREDRSQRIRRILYEAPISALTTVLTERLTTHKKKNGKLSCPCGLTASTWFIKFCCIETYRTYSRNRYRLLHGIPVDKPIAKTKPRKR